MPDLAAACEAPRPGGFEVIARVAIFAPAGTPNDNVDRVSGETRKALAKPEIRERISRFAAEMIPMNPEQPGEFTGARLANQGKRIKDAGIEPE